MNIAIIPARGQSKRIPRKNVTEFHGKPIIAYAIIAAKASDLFDKIVVSTDDNEVASISEQFGAEAPFRRPSKLSDDNASTDSVLLHAVKECQRIYGRSELGCCVYPTSPLLTHGDLRRGLQMLMEHQATSAFPVVRYDFPIEQAFILDGVHPRAKWPEKLMANSQDLPVYYHDAGMFYWFDVDKFTSTGKLFCADSVAFVIASDRCQDINTLEDWKRAELKFRILSELET